jgi:plasmid stabilization system protein ParE
MKVVWTEQALVRLLEIREFIAADDPDAALAHVARLIARGDSLRALWRRGRAVPELRTPAIREVIERGYRIVYRVRRDRIEILTVFEGHRRLPRGDLR